MSAKAKKYSGFKEKLFFVVVGDSFSQDDLDNYTKRKVKALQTNAKIITIKNLERVLSRMTAYPNPLL